MIDFEKAYRRAIGDGRLQLPRGRAERLWSSANKALATPGGEFWECGVYRGGSASLLAEVLRDFPRPLRLFDTFRGFAGVSEQDREDVRNGRMFYSEDVVEDVRRFVEAEFVSIHPGAIPQGFAGLENSKIAFVNLDVDLYWPTREALSFILPRMVPGGVIVVDDYDDPDWPGVAKAINELGVGGFSMAVNATQACLQL